MKPSPVSFGLNSPKINYNNASKPYNSELHKSNSPVNFKSAKLSNLKMHDINKLYLDGPALYDVMDGAMRALDRTFGGFFNAAVDVNKNFFRTVNIFVKRDLSKSEELEKYIIKNNESVFKFPQKMIDIMKNPNASFEERAAATDWLKTENLLFTEDFSKMRPEEFKKKIMSFATQTDDNLIIKSIYNNQCPDLKVRKVIPENRYMFPGG